VKDFERHYIERLLSECDGNVSRAARMAQKNRRAFFELMRKHEIRGARHSSIDGGAL
jgi:two-component system, NtrC family, response regulator GlrR